jgi:hypothetical protein
MKKNQWSPDKKELHFRLFKDNLHHLKDSLSKIRNKTSLMKVNKKWVDLVNSQNNLMMTSLLNKYPIN